MKSSKLLILIAVAFLLSAAGSPNPTPSPLTTSETQQQQRTAITANAGEQNQATGPVVPTVNRVPSPLASAPSNGNADKDSEKSPSNWWMIVFTGVLALVGVAQFSAMARQARYMRKANAYTRATLRAIRAGAVSAERQAVALDKTLTETAKAAEAAKRSADVAAKSDRPVLVVENFVPHNVGGFGQTYDKFTSIDFRIANCGKGPALEVEASGNIKVARALSMPPDFGDCRTVPMRHRVVEASKNIAAFVAYMPNKAAVLLSNQEVTDANEGRTKLFVYGQITYCDIHRNRYRTLFSTEYLPARFAGPERFFPSPDEYNRHVDDPEDSEPR
jgi:hypothetical protein